MELLIFNPWTLALPRLRMTVKDPAQVDEPGLKALGAKGVLKKGNNIQVIVGTQAEIIADEMKKVLQKK